MRTNLGYLMKTCRKHRGITQQELSKLTGIARPNISRMESGKHDVTWSKFYLAVGAMGYSVTVCLDPLNLRCNNTSIIKPQRKEC